MNLTLAVRLPDKDSIKTYAARYGDWSVHSHLRRYKGPPTPVTGAVKFNPPEMQNPGAYVAAVGADLANITGRPGAPGTTAPATLDGGAARE